MNQPITTPAQGARYFDLLRATEALRNWKAPGLLIGSGLAAGLLIFLGTLIGTQVGYLVTALFTFMAFLLFPVGVSAAGLVLMDQAQGLESRSLGAALMDGVFAALKVLVVGLIGFLVVVAFYVLMALVLVLCKIPGLGPVIYGLSFPVLIVVAGMLFFSLYVALSMAGPAIWSGSSIKGAVAMLWQIATHRMVELLISLFLLGLLLGLVGAVVGGILGAGYASVLSLSLPILGDDMMGGMGGMFGGFGRYGRHGFGEGMGYMMATGFGSMVLFALVGGALMSMALMGMNLIYLRVAADLDPSEAERMIGERINEAKSKAQAIKEESLRRAEEARERMRQQQEARAGAAASAAAPEPVVEEAASQVAAETEVTPPASTCPQCQAAINPDDRFCGECGQKLGQ